jgi:hypothetical protein
MIEDGTCKHAFITKSRYRANFRILLPGGSNPLVQVGALDLKRQKGGIRVDMNPAKFAEGDVEHFHDVMRRIVGPEYHDLMRYALLQRVDFAVDIVHADLSRMLVRYNNAQRLTTFGTGVTGGGRVETYNFGSESSNYATTVYRKDIERVLQFASQGTVGKKSR